MYNTSIRLLLIPLFALVSSCGSITQTKDPSASFNATRVLRERDGSLQIVGDWAIVYASNTAAVPVTVATGVKGHIVGGKCTYSHYVVVGKADRGGAAEPSLEDLTLQVREQPYSRAAFEQAARQGLTITVPDWNVRHAFSAAYVQGVLQRIDAALRNPSAVKARQIGLPWQYEF